MGLNLLCTEQSQAGQCGNKYKHKEREETTYRPVATWRISVTLQHVELILITLSVPYVVGSTRECTTVFFQPIERRRDGDPLLVAVGTTGWNAYISNASQTWWCNTVCNVSPETLLAMGLGWCMGTMGRTNSTVHVPRCQCTRKKAMTTTWF